MDRPAFQLVLALLLLATAGCRPPEPESNAVPRDQAVREEGDMVTATGTVVWYELEGGFFAIRGDDETTYDPINLPADFRADGLRVYFEGRLRNDLMGTRMVGPLIELVTIRRIQSDPT